MLVFRIASNRYINDLTGAGARWYVGRWNHKGISIIYTSSSRALAAIECLVHVSITIVPKNLRIAAIEIPDDTNLEQIEVTDLPENWRYYPAPSELADIGSNWASKNSSLILRVPSAVIVQEYNVLINPNHPDIKRIKIIDVQPYVFDERLIR